jgi:hypothetical protein
MELEEPPVAIAERFVAAGVRPSTPAIRADSRRWGDARPADSHTVINSERA